MAYENQKFSTDNGRLNSPQKPEKIFKPKKNK